MWIKMKKTAKGAEDGIKVSTYKDGETYEVSKTLGKTMIDAKWADEVKAPKPKKEEKDPKKDK